MASFCRTTIDFTESSVLSAATHSTHNTRAFSSVCRMKYVISLKVTAYQEGSPLHTLPTPLNIAEFPKATLTASKTIELLVMDIKGNSGSWMNSAFLHLLSALGERRAGWDWRLHQTATNKYSLKAVKRMDKSAQRLPSAKFSPLSYSSSCSVHWHFCCSIFLFLGTLNLIFFLVSFMTGDLK